VNKFEKDELKHWKKEFYRTLNGTGELEQAKWVDRSEYINKVVFAVILSLIAFFVSAYLLAL